MSAPTCLGCGEPKTYVKPFKVSGDPDGYSCTTEDCGYD